MRNVRYSPAAEADLDEIAKFTTERWSAEQAVRYLMDLEDACEGLAANPKWGRPHRGRVQGMQRFERASHVIFYLMEDDGINVIHILHKNMLPSQHGI